MAGRKDFRGAASRLTLAADIDADDTTITTTGDVTGWPTGGTNPFVVELDRGTAGTAEKVLIQSRSGNTLTVAGSGRGYDGTSAGAHTVPAAVEHVIDAGTVDEANAHVNDDTRDDHSQYVNVARHDTTTRHLLGTSVPAGVPGTSTPGDTASEGASTSAARADHRHTRADSYGVVGSITTEAMGDTPAAGTSATVARADHKHGMPAWGGSTTALTFGGTGAVGTALTPARSDHTHTLPAVPAAAVTNTSASNTADQGINPGEEITMISTSASPAAAAMLHISATVEFREATADPSFAGYLYVKVDGVTVPNTGTKRFHSHAKGGMVTVANSCVVAVAAGSHTITVSADNDVSSGGAIYGSERQVNVAAVTG